MCRDPCRWNGARVSNPRRRARSEVSRTILLQIVASLGINASTVRAFSVSDPAARPKSRRAQKMSFFTVLLAKRQVCSENWLVNLERASDPCCFSRLTLKGGPIAPKRQLSDAEAQAKWNAMWGLSPHPAKMLVRVIDTLKGAGADCHLHWRTHHLRHVGIAMGERVASLSRANPRQIYKARIGPSDCLAPLSVAKPAGGVGDIVAPRSTR